MVIKDEELNNQTIPEYKLKMRELNAVGCSSFVIGQAQLERNRVKLLEEVSADTKFSMLNEGQNKYVVELNQNQAVVKNHAVFMKLYYATAAQETDANYTFVARDTLWPFEVLDFERAVLGTMRAGAGYRKYAGVRKRSTISTVLSISADVVTGAVVGFCCYGYIGAVVGAVVGFIVGVAKMLFE
jgi:hypothetical protein